MLASVDDLKARLGRPLVDEEAEMAAALIQDAEAILLARLPDLLARIESGTVPENAARFVVCSMVLRVLRNPEGIQSQTVEGSSYTMSPQAANGYLRPIPDELALLGSIRTAFTINPVIDTPKRPEWDMWGA